MSSTTKYGRIGPANRSAGRRSAWLGSVPISLTTFQPITLTCNDTLLLSDSALDYKAVTAYDSQDVSDVIVLRRNGCLIVQLDPLDDILSEDYMRLAYQSRVLVDDFSAIDIVDASNLGHVPVVTGFTQDGHVVFDDLFDDIGRIVVVVATGSSVGFMSDGTPYFLVTHGQDFSVTADDNLLFTDQLIKQRQAALVENIFMLSDVFVKGLESAIPDAIWLFVNDFSEQVIKVVADDASLVDESFKSLVESIVDLLALADVGALDKLQLTDFLLFNEQLENSITRWLADLNDLVDSVIATKFQFGLDLIDNIISLSDDFRKNVAAIIADDEAFVDEIIKTVLASIFENAAMTDLVSNGKYVPRDIDDALTFITDRMVKGLEANREDSTDFADFLAFITKVVYVFSDDQDLADETISEIVKRLNDDRMELADEVSAGRLVKAILDDSIGWRDETVKLLRVRLGDDFGTVEELEKILTMMVLEEGLYTDEIEPMITLWKPFFYAYLDNVEIGTTSKK